MQHENATLFFCTDIYLLLFLSLASILAQDQGCSAGRQKGRAPVRNQEVERRRHVVVGYLRGYGACNSNQFLNLLLILVWFACVCFCCIVEKMVLPPESFVDDRLILYVFSIRSLNKSIK